MNNKTRMLFTFLFLLTLGLSAQNGYKMKPNVKTVEIDLLSSYYNQDGNNGAVTGGVGTEKLNDFANMIIVNVPIDSSNSINALYGVDIYSSASTDNIDNNRSSASSMDIRNYGNISYSHKFLSKGWTLGGRLGGSTEYDYNSISGGLDIAKEFNNGNSELRLSTQVFFDKWELYFPAELRGEVTVSTTKRNSLNAQLVYSQVLSKRIQFSISGEAIYMNGLLSTPFHRVYFTDQSLPDIERLPNSRLKIPIALRLNYKPIDKLAIRSYYRFYSDDFEIKGHTASLELPYNINDFWTISTFYRYHTQTESIYFKPFAVASSQDNYYSSDYDLSGLNSSKFGLGVAYSPIYGLSRFKIPYTKRIFMINSVAVRFSRYTRSTGLKAYAAAVGFNFKL